MLATGSATSYFGNRALAARAYGLKDLGEALALRARVLDVFEQASRTDVPEERQALLTFVIVGAGPTVSSTRERSRSWSTTCCGTTSRASTSTAWTSSWWRRLGTVLGGFAAGLGRTSRRRPSGARAVRILFDHMVAGSRAGEVVVRVG